MRKITQNHIKTHKIKHICLAIDKHNFFVEELIDRYFVINISEEFIII